MAVAEYLDFDLLIERAEHGYRARVLSSPGGTRPAHDFDLPFSGQEIQTFLQQLGQAAMVVRRLESPADQAARSFGGRLFDAIFAGDVRDCLLKSRDEALTRDGTLRLRLHLADAPELAGLPWEYLYEADLDRFLALAPETPVMRFLDLPEVVHTFPLVPPLRVLAVIASPSDSPALDVEQEWAKLKAALAGLEKEGAVKVERLSKATLAELQNALQGVDYHVLHFIGHGGFVEEPVAATPAGEQGQEGVLVLEDDQGRGDLVTGRKLGILLHGFRSLRLAVLNACEGARSGNADVFDGVAQSLVRQGIPAVIAMQFAISDRAASALASAFYAAVAHGYPADAALTQARIALFLDTRTMEWGTPVLYLRVPDGRVFDLQAAPGRQTESTPATTSSPEDLPPHPGGHAATAPAAPRRLRTALAIASVTVVLMLALGLRLLRVGPFAPAGVPATGAGTTAAAPAPVAGEHHYVLTCKIWTVVLDQKGSQLTRQFEGQTEAGRIPASVLEQMGQWVVQQISSKYDLSGQPLQGHLHVPADPRTEDITVKTASGKPVTAYYWETYAGGKERNYLGDRGRADTTSDFTVEVTVPGYRAQTFTIQHGAALDQDFTLDPQPLSVAVEDFAGDNTTAGWLSSYLGANPRLSITTPDQLQALLKQLADKKAYIASHPMAQTDVRAALGVDLIVGGSYDGGGP